MDDLNSIMPPPEDPGENNKQPTGATGKFREYIPHIVIFLLGFVGLYFFLKLYDLAFPLASINFKVNREGARRAATEYLNNMGYSVDGYRNTVVFGYYNSTKEFLEKKLPPDQANALMGKKVPVWYWQVRFFKFFQKEEYSVLVDPGGRIIKFSHVISDDDPGGKLTPEEGREKALKFIETQGGPITNLTLVDQGGEPLKARTDRFYTFKENDFDLQGGLLYYKVKFQGDRPGGYSTYLHIPQEVLLQWADQDRKGETLVQVGNLLMVALLIGIIYFVYKRGIRFRWRFAVYIAIALAGVVLLEQTNSIPLAWAGYETNLSRGSFLTRIILGIIFQVALFGVMAFFTGSLGTSLQEDEGKSERPAIMLGGSKIPLNVFIGYAAALIVLGYDVLFYLSGKSVGVWTPLEIPYDNILSTPLPWVNALFVGFSAAVLEEIFFRMCAISYLKKWTGNTALAIVIPAVIWAVLHCNYPQEPFYIRAVELTVVGIFLGWLYTRYGILCTIVCHYALNAIYGGTILVTSNNGYFITSGYITIGLMLIPAVIAFIMKDRLARAEDETREESRRLKELQEKVRQEREKMQTGADAGSVTVSYTVMDEPVLIPSLKFTPFMKMCMFFLAAIGLLGALFINTPRLGRGEKVTINPFQAKKIAMKFLESKGVSLDRAASGVQLQEYPGLTECTYISREMGIKKAGQYIRKFLPGLMWVVRVNFNDRKESCMVLLEPSGKVFTYFREITEDAGKIKIDEKEARKLSDSYLDKFPGNFTFDDFQQKGHKNRNDYVFIYREKAGDVAGAKLMTRVQVQGNDTMGFRKYFEIPDDFKRKLQERGFKDTASLAFLLVVGLSFFIWSIFYSIKRKLQGKINVKFSFRVAVVLAAIVLVGRINNLGDLWNSISFDEPFSRQIMNWVISTLLLTFSVGMFAVYVFSILETLHQDVFPEKPPLAEWLHATWKRGFNSRWVRSGILSAYSLAMLAAFPLTALLIDDRKLPFLRTYDMWESYPPGISYIPALRVLCRSLVEGTLVMGLAVIFILFLIKVFNRSILVGGAVALCLAAVAASSVQGNDIYLNIMAFIIPAVSAAALFAFTKYFFRDNLYAYIIFPAAAMVIQGAMVLSGAGSAFFLANGIFLALIALAPLGICLLPERPPGSPEGKQDIHTAAEK